jgi:hypothetical protein
MRRYRQLTEDQPIRCQDEWTSCPSCGARYVSAAQRHDESGLELLHRTGFRPIRSLLSGSCRWSKYNRHLHRPPPESGFSTTQQFLSHRRCKGMPPTQDVVARSIVDDFSTEEDDEPDDNSHLLSKKRSGTRKPPGPVSCSQSPEHNILTLSITEKTRFAIMVIIDHIINRHMKQD